MGLLEHLKSKPLHKTKYIPGPQCLQRQVCRVGPQDHLLDVHGTDENTHLCLSQRSSHFIEQQSLFSKEN